MSEPVQFDPKDFQAWCKNIVIMEKYLHVDMLQ